MQIDLKSPTAQKMLLSVLAGGSLLGVFFFTHFLPFGYPNQKDRIQELKGTYEAKSTELARAQATVRDLPRFEAEFAQLHERWAQTAELLPTERGLPSLLHRVTLAAQQNGVSFVHFKPEAVRNEQHHTEIPMSLAVYGDYHRIGSFLADLANMRRIVTVTGLTLKTNATKGGTTGTTMAEFMASSYCLNTTSAVPVPEPAPAAVAPQAKKEEGDEAKS
jgi:Tfp pilus assembly protein PilO